MCPLTCNKASLISAAVYDIIIHDATPTAQYTLEMATAQRTRPRAVVGVPRLQLKFIFSECGAS